MIGAESLILPGGIAVRDATNREITPGCCCGLEGWREWHLFEATGVSPWMGHDPDAHFEQAGDTVRLWSHGELSDGLGDPFAIEMTSADFHRALEGAERELVEFLGALRAWAERCSPANVVAVVACFDRAFQITAPAEPTDE